MDVYKIKIYPTAKKDLQEIIDYLNTLSQQAALRYYDLLIEEIERIKLNPDQEIVNTIREGLKRTGGYCPCRRERTEATKCMCQEFKDQIADPGFEGFCHCMLYYKSLQD